MRIYFIILILNLSLLFPFFIAPENPSKSKFPGGYISLGLQFGKDSNAIKFRSYQISLGTSIEEPLMVGLTFGKRYYNNGQSYHYFDLQSNLIFLLGAGIGFINDNNKIFFRKKVFGGLGPFMYSRDWVNYKDKLIKNSGLMMAFPILTVFGNTFHP